MRYFVILSIFIGISLIPAVYAAENYIKMPYAEIEPVIDGKYTFESEWNDAKLTKFQSNGHDFYLQTKQDDNFVYLFFNGVDFQTDPIDNSTSVRYQSLICFDVNADKGDTKQPDDFCMIQTVYNEFGEWVKTENAELKYTSDGESLDKSLVHDYDGMWAFGNENDKFEKLNHLSYEIKIPKESVMSEDRFGFNFRMYFGSASDDLVQLYDGVIWPPESDKDKPSTWGTMSMTKQIFSPLKQFQDGISNDEIKCNDTLVLIQKYDGSPACVTGQTKEKLIERGWTMNLKIAVTRVGPSIYLGPTDIPSANNQFALNFYSHVSQDKENNIFFSPTSIFTAFAIAYEGAKDNTASEMKDVFGFESDDSKRRIGFADMQKQLNMKQQNNTISLANALWVAENFKVLPEYVDAAKTYYNSEVESVNFFSKEKGVDLINSWVDEKTQGKIKKIFEELNPATKLVITNAIYFKGIWEDPFDKTKTTVGDFHVSLDNTVQVPMMQSKTTFPNVAVNDLVQIVELPYEGENFSMLILLPRDVDGMKSLEESLSADNLNKWKGDLKEMKTKVYMPKFKLETEYDLKSILQEMGIHDAFNDADFTGIANSGLYIESAVHKAFVEVNEEGTEAAAATGIAMFQSGPFEFTVDRPFIFIIQDNETGSILFIGKVVNPLQ